MRVAEHHGARSVDPRHAPRDALHGLPRHVERRLGDEQLVPEEQRGDERHAGERGAPRPQQPTGGEDQRDEEQEHAVEPQLAQHAAERVLGGLREQPRVTHHLGERRAGLLRGRLDVRPAPRARLRLSHARQLDDRAHGAHEPGDEQRVAGEQVALGPVPGVPDGGEHEGPVDVRVEEPHPRREQPRRERAQRGLDGGGLPSEGGHRIAVAAVRVVLVAVLDDDPVLGPVEPRPEDHAGREDRLARRRRAIRGLRRLHQPGREGSLQLRQRQLDVVVAGDEDDRVPRCQHLAEGPHDDGVIVEHGGQHGQRVLGRPGQVVELAAVADHPGSVEVEHVAVEDEHELVAADLCEERREHPADLDVGPVRLLPVAHPQAGAALELAEVDVRDDDGVPHAASVARAPGPDRHGRVSFT